MSEKIELNDWVHHLNQKVVGKVMEKLDLEKPSRQAFRVWVSDKLPLQVWELKDTLLYQKASSN